jgi:hypothetical protein
MQSSLQHYNQDYVTRYSNFGHTVDEMINQVALFPSLNTAKFKGSSVNPYLVPKWLGARTATP